MNRLSPGATALKAVLTAQPAGITVFTVAGFERLAFTTADVAALLYGPPADTAEAELWQARVVDLIHRGELRARKVGRVWLISGDALAEFVASLDPQHEERRTA